MGSSKGPVNSNIEVITSSPSLQSADHPLILIRALPCNFAQELQHEIRKYQHQVQALEERLRLTLQKRPPVISLLQTSTWFPLNTIHLAQPLTSSSMDMLSMGTSFHRPQDVRAGPGGAGVHERGRGDREVPHGDPRPRRGAQGQCSISSPPTS